MINLMKGDCLERMKEIPDKSVDMVLTDPPYGTTACKWDSVIDFKLMWAELKRIVKNDSSICLFSKNPFTAALITSNIKNFKEELIWHKDRAANFANAKHRHMGIHENIAIFGFGKMPFFPVKKPRTSKRVRQSQANKNKSFRTNRKLEEVAFSSEYAPRSFDIYDKDFKNPESIIYNPIVNSSSKEKKAGNHPTQKPVALLEYLVKTYTLENETVLDFTMGSGSTSVACKNLNRNFIGIERDDKYFEIAKTRIENA